MRTSFVAPVPYRVVAPKRNQRVKGGGGGSDGAATNFSAQSLNLCRTLVETGISSIGPVGVVAPYSLGDARLARCFSSRSMPSRITSRRDSPSSRTASSRSTVSVVSGNVSRSGHCFFLPTTEPVSDVRNSAKVTPFSYVRY